MLSFTMSEGMFTVLVVQVFTVILFILKDRADRTARREEREERAALALMTRQGLVAVKTEGGEREARIIAHVEEVKTVAAVLGEKADAAYSEANNVNIKLASMGIQTKPGKKETED